MTFQRLNDSIQYHGKLALPRICEYLSLELTLKMLYVSVTVLLILLTF